MNYELLHLPVSITKDNLVYSLLQSLTRDELIDLIVDIDAAINDNDFTLNMLREVLLNIDSDEYLNDNQYDVEIANITKEHKLRLLCTNQN